MEQRPSLVVLERLFAATPRGAALINRIKSDPQLAHTEVRVMSHTGDYTRQVVKPTATRTPAPAPGTRPPLRPPRRNKSGSSSVATEEAPKALDWHGTRRAPRFRVRAGVELQLDGNPAAIVDLSTVGAQVISPTVLRPNQKVRIALPNDDFLLRFRGAVAWAKFELPKAAGRRRSTAPGSNSRTATRPPSILSSTGTGRRLSGAHAASFSKPRRRDRIGSDDGVFARRAGGDHGRGHAGELLQSRDVALRACGRSANARTPAVGSRQPPIAS